MNLLALVASLLGIAVCFSATVQLWQGKFALNSTTYLLWGILDGIAGASILLKAGSNWFLPLGYSFMCFTTFVVILLRLRTFAWTTVETITTIAVVISIIVWANVGPTWATVASTLGVVIACVPQGWDTWRQPEKSVIWVWVAFAFVNGLSTLAGKDWSITERFYPGMNFLATLVLTLLAVRKLDLK